MEFHPFVGSHLRLFASDANGRKNGKNRTTVNNTNNKNGSTVKKPTQNASAKAIPSNSLNKQQSQQMKMQSTSNFVAAKTNQSTNNVVDSKIDKQNAQNKPSDIGKSVGKIVNITIFGFISKFQS